MKLSSELKEITFCRYRSLLNKIRELSKNSLVLRLNINHTWSPTPTCDKNLVSAHDCGYDVVADRQLSEELDL